jgi:hypothetical protein
MTKKYELLNLTELLSRDIKIHTLSTFISKITMNMNLDKYYGTCEFTLFLYNCILNADLNILNETMEIEYLTKLHNSLFNNMPNLNNDTIEKIRLDLKYIKTHKMFTKISIIHYYANLAYTFFFCPNIYVIEQ